MSKQTIYVVDDIVNMRVVDTIQRHIVSSCFEEYVSYKNTHYLVTKDFNNDRFISLEVKETPIGTFHPIPQRKKLECRNQVIHK